MDPLRTLVAIATYNERENLPSLVDAVEASLPGADLLVVDDNSPDGTGDWCQERAATDPRLRVRRRAGKLGLGTATREAMRHAIGEGYDTLVTLDADWSHPPDRLPALVEALADADVAIGSRYVPGGAIVGWPLRRRVASRLVNLAARGMLRLPVTDASGAMRAYRVASLVAVGVDSLRSPGYAYLEEVLWRLKRVGARFAEVPITFTERRAGASKISLREAAAAGRLMVSLGSREWLGWNDGDGRSASAG